MNYHAYIVSTEWRAKHKPWLKACGRCPITFRRLGGGRGKYNIHHTHYQSLGKERLWWDVIPLSKWVHDFIVHGILSGFKRPSQQRNYPNLAQRLFHNYCRLTMLLIMLPAMLNRILIFAFLFFGGIAGLRWISTAIATQPPTAPNPTPTAIATQPTPTILPTTPSPTPAAGELIQIRYEPTHRYVTAKQLIEEVAVENGRPIGVLELAAKALQSRINVQASVFIARECGTANAYQSGNTITLCYELVDLVAGQLSARGFKPQEVAVTTRFSALATTFHEIGHLLIEMYQLPITGSEEDAADQFQTLFMLENIGEFSVRSAALDWAIRPENTSLNEAHSPSKRRMFAVLCLLYGSNPNGNQEFVRRLGFDSDRQGQCQRAFSQGKTSWETLLKPYSK